MTASTRTMPSFYFFRNLKNRDRVSNTTALKKSQAAADSHSLNDEELKSNTFGTKLHSYLKDSFYS